MVQLLCPNWRSSDSFKTAISNGLNESEKLSCSKRQLMGITISIFFRRVHKSTDRRERQTVHVVLSRSYSVTAKIECFFINAQFD